MRVAICPLSAGGGRRSRPQLREGPTRRPLQRQSLGISRCEKRAADAQIASVYQKTRSAVSVLSCGVSPVTRRPVKRGLCPAHGPNQTTERHDMNNAHQRTPTHTKLGLIPYRVFVFDLHACDVSVQCVKGNAKEVWYCIIFIEQARKHDANSHSCGAD